MQDMAAFVRSYGPGCSSSFRDGLHVVTGVTNQSGAWFGLHTAWPAYCLSCCRLPGGGASMCMPLLRRAGPSLVELLLTL
jgi:hypothetical protein